MVPTALADLDREQTVPGPVESKDLHEVASTRVIKETIQKDRKLGVAPE